MSADWISMDERKARRTPEQRQAIERARTELHRYLRPDAGTATPDERLFFDAMAQPIRTDIPRPADPVAEEE